MTDTERLDWLEENGHGLAIINDDNGRWAVSWDGIQNVGEDDEPYDLLTSHFVEKGRFFDTIREAIDKTIEEYEAMEE